MLSMLVTLLIRFNILCVFRVSLELIVVGLLGFLVCSFVLITKPKNRLGRSSPK